MVLALAVGSLAQAAPKSKPIFVQSFRKGRTRVAEQSLFVNLTSKNPKFETRIKDGTGNLRYVLSFMPQTADIQDLRVVGWEVSLVDTRRKYMGNLLVASPPTGLLSDKLEDRAWQLDPSPYAGVPLLTKRVFKVEDFYCVVDPKERQLLRPDRFLLESLKIEVTFTGTNPLAN